MELKSQLEYCLAQFRAGTLTEADLQQLLATLDSIPPHPHRQSLLYLQASSTHPYSNVIGLSIFEDGKDQDGVDANGQFLYRSIKAALDDGWCIIKFPEVSLSMDDQNNYGLGFEFILERWR